MDCQHLKASSTAVCRTEFYLSKLVTSYSDLAFPWRLQSQNLVACLLACLLDWLIDWLIDWALFSRRTSKMIHMHIEIKQRCTNSGSDFWLPLEMYGEMGRDETCSLLLQCAYSKSTKRVFNVEKTYHSHSTLHTMVHGQAFLVISQTYPPHREEKPYPPSWNALRSFVYLSHEYIF